MSFKKGCFLAKKSLRSTLPEAHKTSPLSSELDSDRMIGDAVIDSITAKKLA